EPILEREAAMLLQQAHFGDAVPVLSALVAWSPREPQRRYQLATALLNSDPEARLPELTYHYLIYTELARLRKVEVRALELKQPTASAYYALGRLAEDLKEPARDLYRQALALNPNHAASKQRLAQLK